MLFQEPYQPPKDYFKNTFCIFNEVPLSAIANKEPDFKSDSGSCYYYTREGMFRLSNHWGRLANSKWRLIAKETTSTEKIKLGYAKWEAFFPDNDLENLYYITADFENHTAEYYHKNCPDYNGKAIIRTYKETQKRLKNIRNLLILTNWAKQYSQQDIEELRRKIITELIYTDKTLQVIKSEVSKV